MLAGSWFAVINSRVQNSCAEDSNPHPFGGLGTRIKLWN
jgi:hypothetical protein